MSNCCTDQKTVTKLQFLEGKAHNFKNYLLGFNPDEEALKYINSFEPQMMVGTISGVIVPLVQLGQVSEAADEILKHLKVPEAKLLMLKRNWAPTYKCLMMFIYQRSSNSPTTAATAANAIGFFAISLSASAATAAPPTAAPAAIA